VTQAPDDKKYAVAGLHDVVFEAANEHVAAPVPEQATQAPLTTAYPLLHVTHVVPLH